METPTDDTESMTAIVRRIALRELLILDTLPMLGEDGLDRLAKIALVLQRVRNNDKPEDPAKPNDASGLTNDQLMRRANG